MTDKFTKEKIPEIANYIHEVSLTVQLRELESVQDMLTFLSFNGAPLFLFIYPLFICY